MLQGLGQESWFSLFIFFLFMIIMTFYGQKIQMMVWISEIERALRKLRDYVDKSKGKAISVVKKYGMNEKEIKVNLENFIRFFIISPVDLDPAGVLGRLEFLLDKGKERIHEYASILAPKASESETDNIENILGACIVLDNLYRIVRHFLLLGKKSQSTLHIMQVHMQLPLIMKFAKAYFSSLKAFSEGHPIGDGVGPLVVFYLMDGAPTKEIAKDVVMAEREFEGRKLILVKAKGPGGNVGKPGEAIKKIIEEKKGEIDMIIMIDAAGKLEGEKTGEIAEGIGAAIGDPGPEKYKIEESARKYGIPLNAVIIKQSLIEAVTTMKKEIAEAAVNVVEVVKKRILENTSAKATVLVAGIGNSVGISQ